LGGRVSSFIPLREGKVRGGVRKIQEPKKGEKCGGYQKGKVIQLKIDQGKGIRKKRPKRKTWGGSFFSFTNAYH